jgi:hypothetical protein
MVAEYCAGAFSPCVALGLAAMPLELPIRVVAAAVHGLSGSDVA